MHLSSGQAEKLTSFFCVLSISVLLCTLIPSVRAQGGTDYTGTGGRNTIQGRIYFPSGRQMDSPGVKVKLENAGSGELSVLADTNGSFSFRNLLPGSYAIVVDVGKDYEPVRESVYIDDPGASGLRTNIVTGGPPRVVTLPIYLIPKRNDSSTKPAVINAALASVPKQALDLYQKALESSQTNDNRRAIEQLKAALSLYPEFPVALNEMGVQYLKLGQPNEAVEAFRAAIKISPDAFIPRLNYGVALLEKNAFAEAEIQLREALKKNADAPTAHMYLGITLIKLRKYDEAESELQHAISSGGDSLSQVHRYLGGLYWSDKKYKLAADELEKYLRLDPKAADAEKIRSIIKDLRSKA